MEFTGERLILGKVDKDLETEHIDRYRFAEQFVNSKTVLDAACGSGYGTAILGCSARSVVGIDISSEAVEYAKENYADEKISFECASVTCLPFPNESFDVVVSFETIEHIDQVSQELFIQEILRVLKPDGTLIISTPNREVYDKRGINEFHVAELSYKEFKDVLENRFKYVKLFSQKWEICDAIIGNETGIATSRNEVDIEKAEYLIAVCSQNSIQDIAANVLIKSDDSLSKLISWARENDSRNTANNAHLAELDQMIADYREKMQNDQTEFETLNNQIKRFERDIRNKEDCISTLQENEQVLIDKISEKEKEVTEQQHKLKEQKSKLAEQENKLVELGSKLAEQESRLVEQEGRLADRKVNLQSRKVNLQSRKTN